uniref:Homeobox domain-containing protein n=1 Tax=Globodera rostochiensis TaxID=31243 RepID=A0A914H9J3_GLORO
MRFSRDQLEMLERAFHETHYPNSFERENLGAGIGVAGWQVKRWFQNRRAKYTRMDKEAVQLFFQHNTAAGGTLAVPEQSVAAAAPSTDAAAVCAAKSANRCGKGKGRRRAVTSRTKTTRQAAGGKRKIRRGILRTKAVAAAAADK